MRWLPPLNALRAFEAVGRLRNFKEASWELNVTVPAVKHQVRLLEEHLGVDLFARTKTGLVLTSDGRQFMHHVSFGFDQFMRGYRQVGNHEGRKRLVVEGPPGFMFGYLLPRIHKFHEANPELLLEVNTQTNSLDEVNFTEGLVDVALRSGPPYSIWKGVHAEKLVHPELMPVCAPSLLKGPVPLKTPADLANHTLLIARSIGLWEEWIEEAEAQGHDMSRVDWRRGMYFNQSHMSTMVAKQGWGVDLGSTPLISEALRDGSLVAPFGIKWKTQMAYWLLCPKKSAQSGAVRAFRLWLQKELKEDGCAPSVSADVPVKRSPKLKLV